MNEVRTNQLILTTGNFFKWLDTYRRNTNTSRSVPMKPSIGLSEQLSKFKWIED